MAAREVVSSHTGALASGTLTADTWIAVDATSLKSLVTGAVFTSARPIEGIVNHLDGAIYWRVWDDAANNEVRGQIASGGSRLLRGKVDASGNAITTVEIYRPAATTDGVIEFEVGV